MDRTNVRAVTHVTGVTAATGVDGWSHPCCWSLPDATVAGQLSNEAIAALVVTTDATGSTTTTTTAAPTTTSTTPAAVAPFTGDQGDGSSGAAPTSTGTLPVTGSASTLFVMMGAILLAGGLALVLAGRSRRRS